MRGSRAYDGQLEHKKQVYDELRLPAIFVTPGFFSGYWPGRLAENIRSILEERLNAFRKLGPQVSCRDWGFAGAQGPNSARVSSDRGRSRARTGQTERVVVGGEVRYGDLG